MQLSEGRFVLGIFRSERKQVLNRSRQNDRLRVMLALVHIDITPPHSIEKQIRENDMYTNEEYNEMVLLYEQCNRNKGEFVRLYGIKFPSRRHLSYCTIAGAVQRLYKAGSSHRRIPLSRVTPSSLRIPAEDATKYVLAHSY
ncbi:DUF4817 domain-containing protein [Trichonephila clavipes]|nr:DUF4817 domain-containing protein [Trichonephila clavipes]